MLLGLSSIVKEQLVISTKVSSANLKTLPEINICRIDNVNLTNLTADIYLPETSVTLLNVPISFPSKGYGYGAYFMPQKNSLSLVFKTTYGRYYILGTSSISNNQSGQSLLEGENVLLSSGGAYIKQDIIGNNIISSANGNGTYYCNNLLNSEITIGKEEKTLSSNIVRGIALDVNKIENSIIKNDTIKLINYEEYFSNVNTIKTYSPKDILINGTIASTIETEIRNNASVVTNKISDFIEKSTNFINNIDSVTNTTEDIENYKQNFVQDINTNFKLSKNMSLIIQKGNVVSKKIESADDVYNLVATDFETSADGNNLIFKMSILDPSTQLEKAYISIDSQGNAYMKFKKLVIETDTKTTTF